MQHVLKKKLRSVKFQTDYTYNMRFFLFWRLWPQSPLAPFLNTPLIAGTLISPGLYVSIFSNRYFEHAISVRIIRAAYAEDFTG